MKNSTLFQRMVDNYKYHVNQKLQLRCNSIYGIQKKRKIKQSKQDNYGFAFSFSEYKEMHAWNLGFGLYIASICHMFFVESLEKLKLN